MTQRLHTWTGHTHTWCSFKVLECENSGWTDFFSSPITIGDKIRKSKYRQQKPESTQNFGKTKRIFAFLPWEKKTVGRVNDDFDGNMIFSASEIDESGQCSVGKSASNLLAHATSWHSTISNGQCGRIELFQTRAKRIFRIQWLIPPKTQWILVNLRNFKRDYSETMQLKIKTITKMFQWRSNSKKIIGICATNHPSLVCTAVQCRYWCVLFGFVHSPLDFLSRSFSEVQSGCFGCYSERFQSSNNRNAMESLTNWSVYTLHTNIGSTDLCIRIMTLHLDSLGWLYRDCLSLERESDMHTELYMATYISTPKYDLFK